MDNETQHCFLTWFAESRNIGALEIAEELDDEAEVAPGWSWGEILTAKRSSCIHAMYLKNCGRSKATTLHWNSKKCKGWHVFHMQDHTKCNCGASSSRSWSPLWGHRKLAADTWACPFLPSAMLQTDFVARTSWDVCMQLPVASITNRSCAWKTFHLSLAFGIDVWTEPRFCFASFSFSSLSFWFLRLNSLQNCAHHQLLPVTSCSKWLKNHFDFEFTCLWDIFYTQPATLFPGLESDVAAPWQPVKVTSLEKNKKQSYDFFLLHNILKVIFFPGAIDNQFSS